MTNDSHQVVLIVVVPDTLKGIAIGMEVERYRLTFLVSYVISQDMVQVNA